MRRPPLISLFLLRLFLLYFPYFFSPLSDFILLYLFFNSEDQGSSYMMVSCGKCGVLLGRAYRTTPSSLDHLRDLRDLLASKDERRTRLEEVLEALKRWEDDNVREPELTRP